MMVDKKNKICTHPNYKIVMLLIPFFPREMKFRDFLEPGSLPPAKPTPVPHPNSCLVANQRNSLESSPSAFSTTGAAKI